MAASAEAAAAAAADLSPHEIKAKFESQLRELRSSREPIAAATELACRNAGLSLALISVLRNQLAEPSCPNRVALFYLLDSIVKNAKKRDAPEYLNLVVQDLQDIVRQALGIRTSIRHPDGAVFNQMKPIVVKVLALWHQRGVISDQAHQQVLDLITEVTGHVAMHEKRLEAVRKRLAAPRDKIEGVELLDRMWRETNGDAPSTPPPTSSSASSSSSSSRPLASGRRSADHVPVPAVRERDADSRMPQPEQSARSPAHQDSRTRQHAMRHSDSAIDHHGHHHNHRESGLQDDTRSRERDRERDRDRNHERTERTRSSTAHDNHTNLRISASTTSSTRDNQVTRSVSDDGERARSSRALASAASSSSTSSSSSSSSSSTTSRSRAQHRASSPVSSTPASSSRSHDRPLSASDSTPHSTRRDERPQATSNHEREREREREREHEELQQRIHHRSAAPTTTTTTTTTKKTASAPGSPTHARSQRRATTPEPAESRKRKLARPDTPSPKRRATSSSTTSSSSAAPVPATKSSSHERHNGHHEHDHLEKASDANANASRTSSPDFPVKPIVVVWELETLVLFHSLVLGSLDVHANRKAEGSDDNNGDGDDDGDRKKQRLMYMGLAMERLVFHVADKLLHYRELEEIRDLVTIESQARYDDGKAVSEKLLANSPLTLPQATTGNGGASDAPKISWKALAYRLRYVQEQYTEGRIMTWLASQGKLEQLEQLYQQIDTAAHSWLTRIKAVLALGHGVKIHSSDGTQVPLVVHTVACVSQHLLLALVKCALYQLSPYIAAANVYCSFPPSQARKNKLFKRIVHRFSPRATYVVVGRGEEERTASRVHNLPHEHVRTLDDLARVHKLIADLVSSATAKLAATKTDSGSQPAS